MLKEKNNPSRNFGTLFTKKLQKSLPGFRNSSFRMPAGMLLVSVMSFFLLNFMFLTPGKLRWMGLTPQITINADAEKFGANAGTQDEILYALKNSASIWFKAGSSPLSLLVKPADGLSGHTGVNEIQCNAGAESIAGGEQISLVSSALHAFGHVVGLDHCNAGDTLSFCQNRLGSEETLPLNNSVMVALPGSAITLSDDDRTGLQSLYGILDLPFPADGPYSLSAGDIEFHARTINEINSYIKNEADWHQVLESANSTSMGISYSSEELNEIVKQDLISGNATAFDTSRRMDLATAIEEERSRAESFTGYLVEKTPELTSRQLKNMRHYLSSGLVMNSLVKKHNNGPDPFPLEFLNISRENLTIMREAIIDELNNRGETE